MVYLGIRVALYTSPILSSKKLIPIGLKMRNSPLNIHLNLLIPLLRNHKRPGQNPSRPVSIPANISSCSLQQQHGLIVKLIQLKLRILINFFNDDLIPYFIILELVLFDYEDCVRWHERHCVVLEDYEVLVGVRTWRTEIFQYGDLVVLADGYLSELG